MGKCKLLVLNFHQFNILTLLFVITCLLFSKDVPAKDKPYPGELIDIGTHRLHIHCVGHGSPTVIIDSGIGGFSLEWTEIQNTLADNVKVCSYDRAGYGWSDLGPRPRTTARITNELHKLLIKARIPGPYILVGHSFGGYNVRYFASKHPELITGLILIDASHPEQFNTEEFKRHVQKETSKRKYRNGYKMHLMHPIVSNNFPSDYKHLAFFLMSRVKSKNTYINELDYMEISARQVAQQTNHTPYLFPVVILTRGQRVWPYNELGERREQQWLRLQNDLKNISMQSMHYLAEKSGHIIHLDQPEFVSANIMATVAKVRNQMYEQERIRKYDIRHPVIATIPSLDNGNMPFIYNADPEDENSILNKSIHQVMFHNRSSHFGNYSTYFLH